MHDPNEPGPGPTPEATAVTTSIVEGLRKVFVGQDALVEGVLVAIIAGGHVLVESNPGLGKTLLVKGLARVLGLGAARVQFTPDLMPADIIGSHVFNLAERRFEFRQGPVFTRFLLADEINRSPAKTHAALLEAMQEKQVTLDGNCYHLPRPFLVVATQNPIESEGTYQLPEAALDRFLLKLQMDYPSQQEEERIVALHLAGRSPIDEVDTLLEPVGDPDTILRLQAAAGAVDVDPSIIAYLTAIVRGTRTHPALFLGASPRACVSLLSCARALAILRERDYVVPDDIADMAAPVLRHRIMLTPEAEIEQRSADSIISDIVSDTSVPRT
ncbi:MAG: AAA family ATPase [Planctomycetota bacterium]